MKYQVSYQQVYQWTKKYRKMGKAGLQDRRGKRIGSMPSRTTEEALHIRNSRGEMLWLYAPDTPIRNGEEIIRGA